MAIEVPNQNHHHQKKQHPQQQIQSISCAASNRPLAGSSVELEEPSPLPFGWHRHLDLQTGKVYYERDKTLGEKKKMSRNGKGPRLNLKLNLSPPPRPNRSMNESPNRSSSSSSPPSSCVSSESEQNSPEVMSMVLAGCPRCLMYVMLSDDDPKCPKCKSTVLLDFNNNNNSKSKKNRKS
ncbi:hypothetical protein QJS04_geneDACA011710 [Acorus gramineus]|uniref:GIR1-like zinc ribbon domain-containing protein n=1 Tax=Acorus gramineus TaxID=55184 RepID=A0AAV9BF08_ACOGR|nr:hypothetical protein QJS04_geneDACA011710 [Acorus gramineus]